MAWEGIRNNLTTFFNLLSSQILSFPNQTEKPLNLLFSLYFLNNSNYFVARSTWRRTYKFYISWQQPQSYLPKWQTVHHLLSSKYVAWPNFLISNNRSSSSPTWSSIIRIKNILRDDFSWRAGFGCSSF
jgi:hypothetical protein